MSFYSFGSFPERHIIRIVYVLNRHDGGMGDCFVLGRCDFFQRREEYFVSRFQISGDDIRYTQSRTNVFIGRHFQNQFLEFFFRVFIAECVKNEERVRIRIGVRCVTQSRQAALSIASSNQLGDSIFTESPAV